MLRGKFNGAKHTTEAWAVNDWVGERRILGLKHDREACGLYSSENAGMSSENCVRIIMAEYLRFPGVGSSTPG